MSVNGYLVGAVLMVVSASVTANSLLAQGRAIGTEPRPQTERWLQLQREGNAASRYSQAATPAERELANRRWLESYEHPIPDFFEQGIEGSIDN
ncbi:DUF3613 domain-containing protein [Oceanisphaera sp. KMM 10153]|uniref:DUF3613 domain-containing protein n=1 Tax=Oceanisphaera submarina TaxID=3390193 RepID=UPI003976D75C